MVSVREKVSYKISGKGQGVEAIKPLLTCRKRIDEIETGRSSLAQDEYSGNLFTDYMVSGTEVARTWPRLLCGTWEPGF